MSGDGGDRGTSPPELSLGARILLWVVGLALLALGIAGLVLPALQGVLTIAAGVAVLSIASETAHRLLRRALSGWPGVMQKVERFREKVAGWMGRGGDRRVDK